VLVANTRLTAGVAVDDRYVYFGYQDANYNCEVRRVPIAGGPAETVVACGLYRVVNSMKSDGDTLFVRSTSGEAWSVAKANPSLRLLSGPNGASVSYAYEAEIDAVSSVAFWNFRSSTGLSGGLFSANADGSQLAAIDSGGGFDTGWFAPRADDAAVYYWHAGSLIRHLK
jgi:hypothetical protein